LIPFFVWGIVAACLVLGRVSDLVAQPVSFGIKAGVPFTGFLQTSGTTLLGGLPSRAQTPHYAIGPVIEIRLPGQFGLEAGVMYKRIEQQTPDITLIGFNVVSSDETDPIFQSRSVSKVGRSWEFPVAIRYHFSSPSIRPYVEGGFSYNHLSSVFLTSYVVPYKPQLPLPQHFGSSLPSTLNRGGFLLGSGVEIKLPLIDVSPGIRYTRYDNVQNYFQQAFPFGPSRTLVESPNAVDFLVGVHLNSNFHSKTKR
jgi:hypothetical protein